MPARAEKLLFLDGEEAGTEVGVGNASPLSGCASLPVAADIPAQIHTSARKFRYISCKKFVQISDTSGLLPKAAPPPLRNGIHVKHIGFSLQKLLPSATVPAGVPS